MSEVHLCDTCDFCDCTPATPGDASAGQAPEPAEYHCTIGHGSISQDDLEYRVWRGHVLSCPWHSSKSAVMPLSDILAEVTLDFRTLGGQTDDELVTLRNVHSCTIGD